MTSVFQKARAFLSMFTPTVVVLVDNLSLPRLEINFTEQKRWWVLLCAGSAEALTDASSIERLIFQDSVL